MIQLEIEKLLENTIGLKAASIGKAAISRAISERMNKLDQLDNASYLERLKTSSTEIQELIDEVVVPETWFFRDHVPFVALVNHLVENWDNTFELRILSLPCSSGEEPFSIAMALLLAGIEKNLFRIDAVDISKRSLKRARNGEYTQNSFRSKDLRFRDIFFTRQGEKYIIKEVVRQKVRFIQGNVLDIPFNDSLGVYDIIFCRNILIYFDDPIQKKVMSTIERILKPGGVLFTGHAEAALFINPVFKTLDYKGAFGVIKKHGHGPWQIPPKPEHFPDSSEKKALKGKKISNKVKQRNNIVTEDTTLLDKAKKLVNLGEMNSAEIICNKLLDEKWPSPALFFLLGVIKESHGKVDEAIELLRKAVYLDPNHHKSLTFLSLLSQRTGDEAGARNYWRRARKIN